MTGRDDQFCPGFTDLPGLYPTVKNPFVGKRHGPGATTGTAAVGTIAIGVEFPEIITAGPGNSSAFFKISLTKGLKGFTAVVAGIMIGNGHGVHCLVQLNPALLNIFKEQIKNGNNFKFFECFWVPLVQPGPGCKIGVASLGEEENLAVQPPHVVDNPADHGFHRLIVTGKQAPVDPLPIF